MKAVFWHADANFAWGPKVGDFYKKVTAKFRQDCKKYGLSTVHLTTKGHWTDGDEAYFYDLDPKNVVLNREEAFTAFLESAEDGWYWFTEPDTLILEPLKEPKDCDAVFLWRNDDVSMCPAFRMARKSALPLFKAIRDEVRADGRHDWHGDSAAFTAVHRRMGSPKVGPHEYEGLKLQFWDYRDFVYPGRITRNNKGPSKLSKY